MTPDVDTRQQDDALGVSGLQQVRSKAKEAIEAARRGEPREALWFLSGASEDLKHARRMLRKAREKGDT